MLTHVCSCKCSLHFLWQDDFFFAHYRHVFEWFPKYKSNIQNRYWKFVKLLNVGHTSAIVLLFRFLTYSTFLGLFSYFFFCFCWLVYEWYLLYVLWAHTLVWVVVTGRAKPFPVSMCLINKSILSNTGFKLVSFLNVLRRMFVSSVNWNFNISTCSEISVVIAVYTAPSYKEYAVSNYLNIKRKWIS